MSNLVQIDTTLVFAALFGILHVIFSLRVGLYRFNSKISLGDGGDKQLRNLIRGHGNFTENVPIGLLLLVLNDLNGLNDIALISLAAIFLVSRIIHYTMIVSRSFPIWLRPLSMLGTYGTILISAVLLFF